MNLDRFFTRRPNANYTCFNLTCEVWQAVTGEDITDTLQHIGQRSADALRRFRRLARPASPCIALFHGVGHRVHVGVYLNGRVLHLAQGGAMYVTVPTLMHFGFNSVRYYATHNN